MKILNAVLLLLISGVGFSQSAIVWEPEIVVSDGSIFGNYRPRATVVGNAPIVIYGSSGTENLFVSRWNGSGFDTQPILPSGTSSYSASWTSADIASYGDTVVAVFKMNPLETGNVYAVRSTDGGVNFSDTIKVNNYAGGNSWLPSIEMDASGNPVITMMIHDGNWLNPRYTIVHSNDAGQTFGAPEEVVTNVPGEACDCCPAEVITGSTQEILLFRNNDANIRDVYAVMSNDNGQTFPYSENVDQLDWNISACPSTGADGLVMGSDFYTAYASAAAGSYRIYLSKSDISSGLSFGSRNQMIEPDSSNGTQNFPTISGENDTIVMAWEERVSFNKEIYYSVSVPGLDPMTALTTYKYQANETTDGTQTNPDIIYKNGYVHLFYQDNSSGSVVYRRGQLDVNVSLYEHTQTKVFVHPNPAEDHFVVSSDKEIEAIILRDAMGKEIETVVNFNGANHEVSFENVAKGVCYASILYSDGAMTAHKLIIK